MIKSERTRFLFFLIVLLTTNLVCDGQYSGKLFHDTDVSEKLIDDWLFQLDSIPILERTAQEIVWARDIAKRLEENGSNNMLHLLLKELTSLENSLSELESIKGEEKARDIYLAVRKVKRKIMFSDPLIDFNQVLLIDNPYPSFPRYKMWAGQTALANDPTSEWCHEARHRNGFVATPGGKLIVLEGLNPDSPVRNLMQGHEGSFWRPDLSYDGKKVLMSFQPKDELSFHLYEVNIDGTEIKQLTIGDYDDLDPIYLPDGHIMFCTSRANTYVRCMPYTHCSVLARCNADGKDIYITSRNTDPDYMPVVINDGQVVFTRWEYTDKPLWRLQKLWVSHPDGTHVSAFWGNQSVWPDVTTEVRPIPNSNKLMFTGVGHHHWFDGSIGMIDNNKGINYPAGLTKVTQEIEWPEIGDGPTEKPESSNYHKSGNFMAYKSPYPLSEKLFLVSARKGEELPYGGAGSKLTKKDNLFCLYLMDVDGNKELIYKGEHNALYAIPVKSRKKPRIIPDKVKWPDIASEEKPEEGVLYSNNVFHNAPDIPREKVKYMRIIKMVPKTYSTWFKENQHGGPSISSTQGDAVKQILGTIPVEKDGSVSFKLPPGIAVYFQLLDDKYRCVKTMRSFTGVMPGEVRGCKGCHESATISPTNMERSIALRKQPATIKATAWGNETVGYKRFVQMPVFDKYCAECHQGNGEAVEKLDLTFRQSDIRRPPHQPNFYNPLDSCVFYEPYIRMTTNMDEGWWWGGDLPKNEDYLPLNKLSGVFIVEGFLGEDTSAYHTLPAMSAFSVKSMIVENAMSGNHHGVNVQGEDLRRLIAWVDCNGPYYGLEEIREMYDPVFHNIDKIPVRPRVATAPIINRFAVRQDGNSNALAGDLKLYEGTVGMTYWGKRFEEVKCGDILKQNFAVHKSGSYHMVLNLGKNENSGVVNIFLNGKLLVENINLRADGEEDEEIDIDLGRIDLVSGDNSVELKFLSKKPVSDDIVVELKNIVISPQSAP